MIGDRYRAPWGSTYRVHRTGADVVLVDEGRPGAYIVRRPDNLTDLELLETAVQAPSIRDAVLQLEARRAPAETVRKGYFGRAVVDGVPQYTSVSALEKADPRSGGCLRKWWQRYVGGFKDVESTAMAKGNALHAEIERYLKTGDKALSALTLRGLHMMPDPGPDLSIEYPIASALADAPLRADGIPVIGKIDVVHARGTNKGASDLEDLVDPEGTVEVIDWKRKASGLDRNKLSTLKSKHELVRTIQMSGYGEFVRLVVPGVRQVRLSHGYFLEKENRAEKVTKRHGVDEIARSWEYAHGVGRRIREAARETSPDRVDANTNSCNQYGGCPHRETCTAYQANSLSEFYGAEAMGLIQQINGGAPAPVAAPAANPYQAAPAPAAYAPPPQAANPPPWSQPAPAAYAPPPQAAQAPAPAPAPAPPVVAALDMRAAFAAEEAAARAAQAAQPVPGFAEAWGFLAVTGRGTLAVTGRAAAMVAVINQWPPPPAGTVIPGAGDLGHVPPVEDPAQVMAIAREVYQAAQAPAPAPVAQQQAAPPQVQQVAHNAPPLAVLPPDAPASNPAQASKPPASDPPPLTPPPAPVKTPRKPRSPKAAAGAPPAPGGIATSPQGAAEVPADELEVYIDAQPVGRDFESLRPYCDAVVDMLVERYATSGIRDIRCAPKDGPLGYGGWKGAIAAVVRDSPPPPGVYYLDTRGDFADVFADALTSHALRVGAVCVRGTR